MPLLLSQQTLERIVMKKFLLASIGIMAGMSCTRSYAQITQAQDYKNYVSAPIGTFQGINFREAGFSGIYPIPNTNGKEFWVCSDRGVNIDAASANTSGCRPTYDKIYAFPSYAPKIHRIRLNGDSVQILRTITVKRPNGTGATGIINPTGLGSTATEVASTDTVMNCANFNTKTVAKDTFGIDCEGIVVDKDGNFWLCEEGGPSIWKLDQNGRLIKRYTPYANLPGAQSVDAAIDTVFKYRKNNRGFEGIAIAPNGKIYAMIQSPLLYPSASVGEATRVHRLLEIDPVTNTMRMYAYLNDGVIGSGSNQIRLKDWKLGDLTAINDSTFLVLEAAARGTTDIKRMYLININQATAVTSGLYSGVTLEALTDSTGLANNNLKAVKKTLFMDLLANSWPSTLDKAEGVAIINDSTIVICNDNDYAQSSPSENGVATATSNLSHVIKYNLKGANKLQNFNFIGTTLSFGTSGQSSSQAPYLTPFKAGVAFTSIITAGDVVNGYKMCGTPDGMGAFDNGNGTFTVVMNHEFGGTAGVARAHGSTGSFVSKWVINKSDLTVLSGQDLIQRINLWSPVTNSYTTYNSAFPSASAALSRFCSADMPEVSAYYNSITGKGTQERIFMNGEENGNEGRGFAHIVTGPNAGTSYELPALGKFSWENAVANPASGDSTIVVGTDDATPGQVYVYVGAKTTSGTEIEKAGLTNGKLFGIKVSGLLTETNASVPAANTTFTLADLGNVTNMTGTTLNTNSNNIGVTQFLRPEDAAWDPSNPNDLYFNTTNAFGSNSRLWRVRFNNIANPTAGGTITAVLDGSEGQQMLDNMAIDNYGHIILVEDVGGNAHIGKTWQYTIATDALVQVGRHDTTRFLNGSANFLTQDEEATGQLDVQGILGPGMFLINDQAHYGISGEVVEGGQLLAMYNPDTYNANPEINVQGNSVTIVDGDATPSTTDNTDFGPVNSGSTTTKTFVIQNGGPGALTVSGISFTGVNASEFSLVTPPTFPLTISANGTQTVTVQFAPAIDGARTAKMVIANNDFNERPYDFVLQGLGVSPEINVQGNSINIANNDVTPGAANNTDFGNVNTGNNQTKTFVIQNTGAGSLNVTGITFTGNNAAEFTLVSAPTFPLSIAAAASQSITVKFAPTAIGMRTATINIANDDKDEPAYNFAIQGLGTEPTNVSKTNGSSSSVKLYPNPTGNAATIAVNLKKDEHVVVTVYDVQGKMVLSGIEKNLTSGEQQITLNTSTLQNGIYFVQVVCGNDVSKIKMVVMH